MLRLTIVETKSGIYTEFNFEKDKLIPKNTTQIKYENTDPKPKIVSEVKKKHKSWLILDTISKAKANNTINLSGIWQEQIISFDLELNSLQNNETLEKLILGKIGLKLEERKETKAPYVLTTHTFEETLSTIILNEISGLSTKKFARNTIEEHEITEQSLQNKKVKPLTIQQSKAEPLEQKHWVLQDIQLDITKPLASTLTASTKKITLKHIFTQDDKQQTVLEALARPFYSVYLSPIESETNDEQFQIIVNGKDDKKTYCTITNNALFTKVSIPPL